MSSRGGSGGFLHIAFAGMLWWGGGSLWVTGEAGRVWGCGGVAAGPLCLISFVSLPGGGVRAGAVVCWASEYLVGGVLVHAHREGGCLSGGGSSDPE